MKKSILKELILPAAITVGVVIGVGLGLGLRQINPPLTDVQISLLIFPGELMIQMMKVLLLPITTSSIMVAMAQMDIRTTGKIGLRALVYYLTTMIVASAIGLAVGYAISPGQLSGNVETSNDVVNKAADASPGIAFLDFIRNLFPDNLIKACFRKKATYMVKSIGRNESNSNYTINASPSENSSETFRLEVKEIEGMNLMGLLIFSIAFGCILSTLGEKGKPLLAVVEAVYLGSIKLILVVVWYLPVGILFLTAANLAAIDDPTVILSGFAVFFGTMTLGLMIHCLIVLPLIYFVFTRKNPFVFTYHMFPAMLTAFATESSAATIPITIKCLIENNKVDPRVVRMMIPVGATVNMDGSAMYLNLLGIFVANLHGVNLNVAQIVTIVLVSVAIAIGAAGVPGGGAGTTEMILLTTAGLPVTEIYMIVALHWLGARLRTVVNVMGDAYGTGVVEKLSAANLHLNSSIHEESQDCDESDQDLGVQNNALRLTDLHTIEVA